MKCTANYPKFLNSGTKFGRLVVISIDETSRTKINGKTAFPSELKYLCHCDCGNEVSVHRYNLLRGETVSCGCYQKERCSVVNAKDNVIEDCGDYVKVFFNNCRDYVKVDKDDFNKIKDLCWHKNDAGYAVARTDDKLVKMHRLLMGFPPDLDIDHINQNKLDNRKDNLRVATKQQNLFNHGIQRNNISGVKGVRWNKKNRKWVAYISFNGEQKYLGSFNNIEEAHLVRKEKEIELFKEFSPENTRRS